MPVGHYAIDSIFFLELVCEKIDDLQVEVLATKERITIGRQHLELVFAIHFGNLNDRYVEGTTA